MNRTLYNIKTTNTNVNNSDFAFLTQNTNNEIVILCQEDVTNIDPNASQLSDIDEQEIKLAYEITPDSDDSSGKFNILNYGYKDEYGYLSRPLTEHSNILEYASKDGSRTIYIYHYGVQTDWSGHNRYLRQNGLSQRLTFKPSWQSSQWRVHKVSNSVNKYYFTEVNTGKHIHEPGNGEQVMWHGSGGLK